MKKIIKQLRLEIKRLSSIPQGIRCEIQELKWQPGSAAEVARLRSERDESGRKKNGKRALRAYRRPETGTQRWELWQKKHDNRWEIRTHLVLLGMLKGLPYLNIERATNSPILARTLYCLLTFYFGDGAEPYTEGVVEEWLNGKALPAISPSRSEGTKWLPKVLTFLRGVVRHG